MVRSYLQVILLAAGLTACGYRVIQNDRLNENVIHRIVLETAKIRNLPLKHALPVELVDQSVLRAELIADFKKDPEVEKLRTHEVLFKKLGLIAQDADIEKMVLDLLTEQIAGYYDPERKTMRLVNGSTDLGSTFKVLETILRRDIAGEFLMAHELTHALADQNFDLKSYVDVKGNSDQALARKAFVEGEAMLVGLNYMLHKPLKRVAFDVEAGRNQQSKNADEAWEKVPAALKRAILFEYIDGMAFATAVYKQRGTNGLDRVYRLAPRSSEEVLHPEKYLLQNDAPIDVTFDTDAPEMKGLVLMDDDTMGEIGILSILEQPLGTDGAKVTAAGWGGDRFRLYRNPAKKNEIGFDWRTVWDTRGDAIEFAANTGEMLRKRFGAASQSEGGIAIWKTDAGTFEIRQGEDARVNVLLYP